MTVAVYNHVQFHGPTLHVFSLLTNPEEVIGKGVTRS